MVWVSEFMFYGHVIASIVFPQINATLRIVAALE